LYINNAPIALNREKRQKNVYAVKMCGNMCMCLYIFLVF